MMLVLATVAVSMGEYCTFIDTYAIQLCAVCCIDRLREEILEELLVYLFAERDEIAELDFAAFLHGVVVSWDRVFVPIPCRQEVNRGVASGVRSTRRP